MSYLLHLVASLCLHNTEPKVCESKVYYCVENNPSIVTHQDQKKAALHCWMGYYAGELEESKDLEGIE
jgi:hypothetical protein